MSAIEPAQVEIKIGPYGLTGFSVNGQDCSRAVRGLVLSANSDEVPVVEVQMVPGEMEISGPGIVVFTDPTVDKSQSIIDFLESLDPVYVDGKSLDSMDFNTSPTVALLETLKEIARSK